MRIRVEVERNGNTWKIRYPNLGAKGDPPVTVDLVSAGPITLPKTAGFDPGTEKDKELALAVTTLKTPQPGDVARFGGYLFDLLLGAVWAEVQAAAIQAPPDPLETIELSSADQEFHRLPWEMARSPEGFLAKRGVGFVRLVASAGPPRKVKIAPRVLFIVGSDITDKRVKAGAEYLGLIKRLEATSLVMETQVLLRATRKSIEETVQRVKPSIVVFICHGSIEKGVGRLELTPDDRTQKTDYLSGKQLHDLLHGIPQAVVMNACETGASSRSSVPLAWEMVSEQIPLAIGMAGRVADRACRLFSRRFFEALLRGEDVHTATAVARQEGMLHGSDPEQSVDWAMPALFMLDGVSVEVDAAAVKAMQVRAGRAKLFRTISNPLVVCGRTDCIAEYSRVVGTPADLSAPRTLALRVTEKYEGDFKAQYGKTRSLEELAAIGALWGHIPCLVRNPGDSLWQLCLSILSSIGETRQAFGIELETSESQLFKLKKYLTTGAGDVADTVQDKLMLHEQKPVLEMTKAHPEVLLAALQADLAALARDAAPKEGAAAEPRVLVFIDDLQNCREAEQVMKQWVSANGLGRKGSKEIVPLIFTYSSVGEEVYKQVAAQVGTVAESKTTQIASVDLKSLPSPLDDEMPYRQFLLSQKPMLVPSDDDAKGREVFFKGLHSRVRGVPSRLMAHKDNIEVMTWVESAAAYNILVDADDDQLLAQQANAGQV
ncbi:MAG: CHAT domain-containing protein [Candidatus Solibacter sp.]